MSLAPGTRLGPYEITGPLGAGGMGEVYRARDTRLERSVAVKVLPADLARSPEFRQRFEREAKVVSGLNHPHICALYDIGHQDGVDFIVMEYLEGETLAERLRRGPLPAEQVLKVAIAVADALDRAHRQGVVHRDLKPGNVMLAKSGVKLLDFGLAKVRAGVGRADAGRAGTGRAGAGRPAAGGEAGGGGAVGDEAGVSALPTATQDLTEKGTVLGTYQYMAPEQLEGKDADGRTDIFALGAVIYEMGTGRKAFEGKSQASLIAAILTSEPPLMTSLQPLTPPVLDRLVRVCLAKDPEERWQSAGDVRRELLWIAEGSGAAAGVADTAGGAGRATGPAAARRRWRERLAWIAAGAAIGLAVATSLIVSRLREAPQQRHPVRFTVAPPPSQTRWADVALSPDARQIAFVASLGEGTTLWIRDLGSLEVRQLPGTEGAFMPFWSPDGRAVGFFAGGKLKRISVAGGDPQTLADAAAARGGSWSGEGVILFAPGTGSPLHEVPAAGGAAVAVTELDAARKEFSHRYPEFLPDGRRYLFYSPAGGWLESDIYLGSRGSRERRKVMTAPSRVIYTSPGYLLYAREGSLLAQPVDPERLSPAGEPIVVGPRVDDSSPGGAYRYGAFSVAGERGLVYVPPVELSTRLAWFDRAGRRLSSVGTPGMYNHLRLSPDGNQLALIRSSPAGEPDVWLCDLGRGSFSRFTAHAASDVNPIWSPDGKAVVFASFRDGPVNLYRKTVGGAGAQEPLLVSAFNKVPRDWSRDGRFLIYLEQHPETGNDLWLLPLTGDGKPIPYLHTPFDEFEAAISPDGRWLAYTSNETGRPELYVGSFPERARTWRISTDGGRRPIWRKDGREIFFIDGGGKLMAVAVSEGAAFRAGTPGALSQAPAWDGIELGDYEVSPDGQRFLVNEILPGAHKPPITVVLDWTADLKQVGSGGKD